jgi:hypothetical protein
LFYSDFLNDITNSDEKYLRIVIKGSEDGKNRRDKTDIVLVIDRSGSIGCGLYDTYQDNTSESGSKRVNNNPRTKFELTIKQRSKFLKCYHENS